MIHSNLLSVHFSPIEAINDGLHITPSTQQNYCAVKLFTYDFFIFTFLSNLVQMISSFKHGYLSVYLQYALVTIIGLPTDFESLFY